MKWEIIFGIVVLSIVLGLYFYPSGEDPSGCTEAGSYYDNPSLGPDAPPVIECCEDLEVIDNGVEYNPDDEFADEEGCVFLDGGGGICSNCGNANCEQWENKCNCPTDCQ